MFMFARAWWLLIDSISTGLVTTPDHLKCQLFEKHYVGPKDRLSCSSNTDRSLTILLLRPMSTSRFVMYMFFIRSWWLLIDWDDDDDVNIQGNESPNGQNHLALSNTVLTNTFCVPVSSDDDEVCCKLFRIIYMFLACDSPIFHSYLGRYHPK